jgi:hypothetical protein
MAGPTNPLWDTYNAIWTLLNKEPDFVTLFPADSPHQLQEGTTLYATVAPLYYQPNLDLHHRLPADYPVCRVAHRHAHPQTERDTSGSYLDMRYTIEVCTGQIFQLPTAQLCWCIYRPMLQWRTVALSLLWLRYSGDAGVPFIFDVDAEEINYAEQAGDWMAQFKTRSRSRGTNQWITIWSTVVRMQFATADLQAY